MNPSIHSQSHSFLILQFCHFLLVFRWQRRASWPKEAAGVARLGEGPGTRREPWGADVEEVVHRPHGRRGKPGLSTLMHLGSIGTGHNPTAAHGLPPQKGTQTLPTE